MMIGAIASTGGSIMSTNNDPFTNAELAEQQCAELPARELMIGISLLGIPLVGLDGLSANVNTAGPNWLFGL